MGEHRARLDFIGVILQPVHAAWQTLADGTARLLWHVTKFETLCDDDFGGRCRNPTEPEDLIARDFVRRAKRHKGGGPRECADLAVGPRGVARRPPQGASRRLRAPPGQNVGTELTLTSPARPAWRLPPTFDRPVLTIAGQEKNQDDDRSE